MLNLYRDAGTASAKATAKVSEVAARAEALGRDKDRSQVATLAARRGVRGGRADALAVADASKGTAQEMPGPVERILRELGVTDQTLLNRALTLDKASSQLVVEAAEQTAPQRWNVAVKQLNTSRDTRQIVKHVLAQNHAVLTRARSHSPVMAAQKPQPQPEPMQAERWLMRAVPAKARARSRVPP